MYYVYVLCILCDVILCDVNEMYTYYLSGYPSHHVAMDLVRSSKVPQKAFATLPLGDRRVQSLSDEWGDNINNLWIIYG